MRGTVLRQRGRGAEAPAPTLSSAQGPAPHLCCLPGTGSGLRLRARLAVPRLCAGATRHLMLSPGPRAQVRSSSWSMGWRLSPRWPLLWPSLAPCPCPQGSGCFAECRDREAVSSALSVSGQGVKAGRTVGALVPPLPGCRLPLRPPRGADPAIISPARSPVSIAVTLPSPKSHFCRGCPPRSPSSPVLPHRPHPSVSHAVSPSTRLAGPLSCLLLGCLRMPPLLPGLCRRSPRPQPAPSPLPSSPPWAPPWPGRCSLLLLRCTAAHRLASGTPSWPPPGMHLQGPPLMAFGVQCLPMLVMMAGWGGVGGRRGRSVIFHVNTWSLMSLPQP